MPRAILKGGPNDGDEIELVIRTGRRNTRPGPPVELMVAPSTTRQASMHDLRSDVVNTGSPPVPYRLVVGPCACDTCQPEGCAPVRDGQGRLIYVAPGVDLALIEVNDLGSAHTTFVPGRITPTSRVDYTVEPVDVVTNTEAAERAADVLRQHGMAVWHRPHSEPETIEPETTEQVVARINGVLEELGPDRWTPGTYPTRPHP